MALWGWYYSFSLGAILVAILFIYAGLKKDKTRDLRCPKCDFLVDAEDVEGYGNVCPDCGTDWRVYPLKEE
jgi:hypothetical protein